NENVSFGSIISSCSNFRILLNTSYEMYNVDRSELVETVYGCSGGNVINPSSDKICDFVYNTKYNKPGKYKVTMFIRNSSWNVNKNATWSCSHDIDYAFTISEYMNVSLSFSTNKDSFSRGEEVNVSVNLSNIGNIDVFRNPDPLVNNGVLRIEVVNSSNNVIESYEKIYQYLYAGESKLLYYTFTLEPDKYYTARNRIIVKYNFSYIMQGNTINTYVSKEKEIIVGNVGVLINKPIEGAIYYAYPEQKIDFNVTITTINLTTGESQPLDYAGKGDFYVIDDKANTYDLMDFVNRGNGIYTFSIAIDRKGNYYICVRVKDPVSNVVGEGCRNIEVKYHGVALRLFGINESGVRLYIPSTNEIDREIDPFIENIQVNKINLNNYYLFVYGPSFLTGIFLDHSRKADVQYCSFNYAMGHYNLSLMEDYKDNGFIVVFSRARKNDAVSRYELIKSGTFFTLVNPSFGYRIKDELEIKLIFDVSGTNLNLTGNKLVLPQGLYKFKIRNDGLREGKLEILVERV
ncbi:MAG: hypothetical protein OH333_03805, partial [Candidatus Parvarchaeota archaeon]|nr:hypothetical protein [Candidatus Jingweiarchaeum tengchongense]